ncbi:DNA-binding transcriptional LysR family regulator [Kribbella amoyensis]|uniref:DNA-binding transcriptional LysR family regulator n=1 Tax=Kribbella amoyensis TaxID=996641 RepID=A0A561BUK0_9ACTN|nr:LysR family transcriptional regulator [Kribbella amoyensis]TWD82566.1 DNA-binding transcriptional LysR family regulator [Kribbella amoyensis]
MEKNLDLRLVRHFVVVAEELHFRRAATKLFVAQQVLSRDVRKLEDQLGVRLLDRTTRTVKLTAEGELMLDGARDLLARQDDLLRRLRGPSDRLVVDVGGHGTTPASLVAEARPHEAGFEFYTTFNSSLTESLAQLSAQTLDVAFAALGPDPLPAGLQHRLVRLEPLALLVPEGHRFAELPAIPLADLRDEPICYLAGDHVTDQWEEVARQLVTLTGALPAPTHPKVRGVNELAHHIRPGEPAVLTLASQYDVPSAVLRPLVDPTPLYPWTMLWRTRFQHPGVDLLHQIIDTHQKTWLNRPADHWLRERPDG